MEKVYITDLTSGLEIDSPFLVAALSRARTSRGGQYLNVELADRTGRIQAKVWDGAETLAPILAEGTVARVRGYVDSYRGLPQLVIREASYLSAEEFNWPDYLKAAPRPAQVMKAELWALVDSMGDDDYRRLTQAALRHETVADKFYLMPAAKSMHHAYLHGLLEHTLSVAGLARRLADHYPNLNGDLLAAGAILHDVGKVWEFSLPPKTDYTTLGRLKGHLVMGAEFVENLAAEIGDFPAEKTALLVHLILSHHGEPDFGSPVKPQLMEAVALHHLDNLDAKLEAIGSHLAAESDANGWSVYHRLLGGCFLTTPKAEKKAEEGEVGTEPEKPLVVIEGGPPSEPAEEAEEELPLDPYEAGRLF